MVGEQGKRLVANVCKIKFVCSAVKRVVQVLVLSVERVGSKERRAPTSPPSFTHLQVSVATPRSYA